MSFILEKYKEFVLVQVLTAKDNLTKGNKVINDLYPF